MNQHPETGQGTMAMTSSRRLLICSLIGCSSVTLPVPSAPSPPTPPVQEFALGISSSSASRASPSDLHGSTSMTPPPSPNARTMKPCHSLVPISIHPAPCTQSAILGNDRLISSAVMVHLHLGLAPLSI